MSQRDARVACWFCGLLLVAAGCVTAPAKPATEETKAALPAWVDDACIGQPPDTICAVGESELVAASAEAGKIDAETAAQNRLQAQIETELTRLLERLNQATRDLSNGRSYGQKTINDINRNFSEKTLRGAIFAKYFYYPNRMEPKKVFVLAIVNASTVKVSEDVMQSLLAAGERDRLFANAQEAQVRLAAVRKEYLAERAAKAGVGPVLPAAGASRGDAR